MNSSRNKVLLALVAILLLTNLTLVAFFVMKKEPQKNDERPNRSSVMRGLLKDSVGFNDEQLTRFDTIKAQHERALKPLFENTREAKLAYYKQMSKPGDTAALQAASDLIGETQKAVDASFYSYFQKIRAICTQQQLTSYDSVVQRIVRKMVTPAKRGSPKDRKDSPRENK